MSIFKSLTSGFRRKSETLTWQSLLDMLGISGVPYDNLSEATYFACLKVLSEALGKLPLKLLQHTAENGVREATEHPYYNVLRQRPNPYMTATGFWSTVEYNRNHYGNSYCLITGAGKKLRLWILPSAQVEIWYDNAKILSQNPDIWYIYSSTAGVFKFSSQEILHFRTSTTFDGVKGLPVSAVLKSTLEGNQKAQAMLNKLYETGFTAKAVLQYTGNLSDENAKKFVAGIEKFATGSDDLIKSIIPIPIGASLTPLNVKLGDAEFLGIKRYSALQIAAAMGIKPNQINDYEKASYAAAEQQQLAFYVDTLLYILKQYEEEIAYKLLKQEDLDKGLFAKFNVAVILRADLKTQIETLSQAVSNFIYTPNEARAYLDMEKKEGGDVLCGNGSVIPLTQIGQQYQKGGA